MKDFNFNKYIRHGFLLKENVQNDDEPTGDAEYTSDTEFDIWDQGDESDPIGGPLGEDDSEWQEGDEDMFNDWENIPPDVMAILDKYSEEDQSYQILQSLQDELEAIGYTFDWGLDAEPYGLRPMKK